MMSCRDEDVVVVARVGGGTKRVVAGGDEGRERVHGWAIGGQEMGDGQGQIP